MKIDKTMLANHRRLWNWLAKNPGTRHRLNEKYHWPEWEENGGPIPALTAHCFPCDETDLCYECRIDWGSGHCKDPGLSFFKWEGAKTPKTRAKYAAIVRDLQLKARYR